MNNEAIGEVTVAIRNLLQRELGNGYEVSLYSPWEDFGDGRGINLFLYKLEANPEWKNMDWPGDSSNPTRIPCSPLSLDLYYLLTPYAPKIAQTINDTALTHRILGKAMQILHENAVLNDIRNTYFNADDNDHFSEDLRNSFEKIKITLNPTDIKEMSEIWSMGDKNYRTSVAYHVSLVQIAPTVSTKPVAVPVQKTGIKVTPLTIPLITKLEPSSGPVGTELHIIGHNLWLKGFKTYVRISETSHTDFTSIVEDKIILKIPGALKKGPEQRITVVIGGRESEPDMFRVTPWITSIKPQRGAVDTGDLHAIPIDINGYDLQGVVQITIGGSVLPSEDITVISEKLVKAYIPKTLGNGYHDIDLKVNGNPANKRKFEVVPLIQNITPSQGRARDLVTAEGQRLNGTKIRINVGYKVIAFAANADPKRVSFNLPKTIGLGKHDVSVTVDGHESNPVAFKVVE